MFCRCLLGPLHLDVIYPNISVFVSGLDDLSTDKSELLKSLTVSVLGLI